MNVMTQNPYTGPRTFQRDEGHLFFGREREARELLQLVTASQDRLILFYAQSGAGKSSLLNTRLIPNFEEKRFEVLPVGRLRGEVSADLEISNIYVFNLLRSLIAREVDLQAFSRLSLSELLAHLIQTEFGYDYDPEQTSKQEATRTPRRMLIIDQFEELFITHPEAWEQREDFFNQLGQALQDHPALWVMLAMREDFLASLDPFAHLLPGGMRVRYYMQRLGTKAALSAIKNPVEMLRPYAPGVAEKLVDDLRSMWIMKPNGMSESAPGQYVEPVQLQVVCYSLWENLASEGTQITEKDLQDVGDVNQSLGRYYDRRVHEVAIAKNVRERLIREWFEKKLISPSGIRSMVLQEREARPGELADDVIQALQSDLVRAEKRSGATWYELTHDRLVEPILERNKIWFNENLSPLQRQAALWNDQYRNDSWLLTDQALIEVQQWAQANADELTELEQEFLEDCQRLQAHVEEQRNAARLQLELAQRLAEEQARSARRARIFNVISIILLGIFLIQTFLILRGASNTQNLVIILLMIVALLVGYFFGRNR